jgi:hypothetical protein
VTLRQLLSHTEGIVDGPGYSVPLGATLQDNLDATRWSASRRSRARCRPPA